MWSYCLKCIKNTQSTHPELVKTKNGRITLLSKCAVCNSKKLKFIKRQEALSVKQVNTRYKMNKIIPIFLLAGDKYMPEMHLWQPGFTYSACGPFTKIKERIQKFKETGDSQFIYQNELEKPCFQHDMAYEEFKYYVIKHLILLKIQNKLDINVDLLQWSRIFSIKTLLVVVLKMRIF